MKRIKYISRFAKEFSAEELSELTNKAAKRNKLLDITGVLMASGGIFFQVIEGPDEHIDVLYQDIVKDSRHWGVLLLSVEDGKLERLFPDWSMKKFDLDLKAETWSDPLKTIINAIFTQRHLIDEMTKTLERAIWNQLVD